MINKLKKNSFLLNIITLISGSAISQGILFAATPFLTRLYTPEEFGYFSLYAAIVAVLTSVASWKYELAIMLPKEEKDAQAVLFLSILATIITSAFVFILIVIFKPLIVTHITDEVATFIWIVPLGVLFSGLYQVFISFSSRKKYFRSVSVSRISQSGGAVTVQGTSRGFDLFPQGLVWGKLAGDLLALLALLLVHIKNKTIHLKSVTKKDILLNANTYKDFPKYQSLAQFLASLSQNIPFFLLTTLYNPEIAGYYMLTSRILFVPTALIGRSTKEVFYQKASEMYAKGRSIKDLYLKTTLGLAKLGIVPFIIVGIFAQQLFTYFLGSEWLVSGIFAQLIIAWTFLGFINPPSTMTVYILGLQRFSLKYMSLLILFRILSIYLTFLIFNNEYLTIGAYAAVGFIFNLFYISYCYLKVKENKLIEKTE